MPFVSSAARVAALALLASASLALPPLGATPALAAPPLAAAASGAAGGPDARTLACFLLNAMTRATPDLPRRQTLLQAALSSGCLELPGASPFRGQGVTETPPPRETRPGKRQAQDRS